LLAATVPLWQNKSIPKQGGTIMLNENIKALRKTKGLTQDELAIRLNVVRQTVSKWEKGLSVPDAEMLQRIAEVFEVNVSQLLGAPINQNENIDVIAEQLSRINEQLVVKNNRSRKIWKTIGIILAIIIAGQLLLVALGITAYKSYEVGTDTYEEYVEEFVDD
jgi:putative transcriptional regulator